MRLGNIWDLQAPGAYYRGHVPMLELERRGHEIVWPDRDGNGDLRRLRTCDAILVYRRHDDATHQTVLELARTGVPTIYDNDDDYTSIPPEHSRYRQLGGLGGRRLFARMLRMAKAAAAMTTTTPHLARIYGSAGAPRVVVIPNQLGPEGLERPTRHEGIVVGWVAGLEHALDANRLKIAEALREVQRTCPEVIVETIGVRLPLSDRYRHATDLPFARVRALTRGFDVGIAPLADIPFNHSRSDIKLKEYAGCGVPWLASPVGPYAGLGPEQGGRLVADDAWVAEIVGLVRSSRDRRRLRRAARRWAKGQTIARTAGDWEQVLGDAAAMARPSRTAAPAAGSARGR